VQYLTVFHGPRRDLHHQTVAVTYLGQIGRPYSSHDIRCNRFRLTLRDFNDAARATAASWVTAVARNGVPNYFDDQRFGSVAGPGEEFVARLLVRGRFEDALKLALTGRYEFDRAPQKEEKRLLVEHWGDWTRCMAVLPRGHARSLCDYLRVHLGDFRGAVARLRPELRGLYLSVYQSHLWNRMLDRWLRQNCSPDQLRDISLRLGPAPFPVDLDDERRKTLSALVLPLPSARLKLADDDALAGLINSVLAEEDLALRDLQVRGIRELFFSRGERAALCMPEGLTGDFAPDESHPGRHKLTLSFELPRGSYATMIVKAVSAPSAPQPQRD
jgi:tRNA pseudouridine13 synthase